MLETIVKKVEEIILGNLLKSLAAVYIVSIITIIGLWFGFGSEKTGKLNSENIETGLIEEVGGSQKSTKEMIKVEISGAVVNPGVFEFQLGSRLIDLISEAGGFDNNASELWITKNINLSSKLTDSQKIYIPFKWDVNGNKSLDSAVLALVKPVIASDLEGKTTSVNDAAEDSNSASSNLINVNTASQEDIDALPGIGPVYAARIIENRPYEDLSGFEESSELPANVIENIKDLITY